MASRETSTGGKDLNIGRRKRVHTFTAIRHVFEDLPTFVGCSSITTDVIKNRQEHARDW